MAIGVATIWRVRTGGNDANGGGFDATISGAGTDYSQQDSPQLSLTDIACSATTTVTSATGGFTSAMIGNAIRISGGGATAGWYFITARTDTNTITVDRTPGTVTAGTGKVGGGVLTPKSVLDNANATGSKCVAGNTIYIQGAGTDTPSSADYTWTGYYTPVAGTKTEGFVRVKGENGRPRLHCNGLMFYLVNGVEFENLYLSTTSNSNALNGILNGNNNTGMVVRNCVIDCAGQSSCVGIQFNNSGAMYDSEVIGATSPTANSGSHGVMGIGFGVELIGNRIHHCRDAGIYFGNASFTGRCERNQVYANIGDGVYIGGTDTVSGSIAYNTIDGNSGHGINVNTTAAVMWHAIHSNIISNNLGSSKYAINLAAGATALNDRAKRFCDFNTIYNNTGTYNNISAGANDITLNPTYANAGSYDFTPGNASLKGVVYPPDDELYPGAIQPAGSGGGGMLYIGGMSGGFE